MSVNNNTGNYSRLRRIRPKTVPVSAQKERNLSIKKVSVILQKDESKRTKEEKELLFNYSEVVKEAALRLEKRQKLKDRLEEKEDSEVVMDAKCKQLAEAMTKAEYLVVYTGAGISTAARIPDYRGTSGIWTLLQQGKDIGSHDLTQAEPTYTHMAISQLHSQGRLQHVVSQNCDGLHLRSGLPKRALSEVHGNMYIEVCRSCRPIVEYLRLFDVTENTARYSHKTMRRCYKCNSPLVDSIVHFGERGNLPWPLNWKGACRAAEKADMILCIGSSLKVLKRYPWLWSMDKPAKRRPQLYIVNLQWTPKDCHATIKINGKCDDVMKKLMKYLSINVSDYSRDLDPIFKHATPLCKEEAHTTNRPSLRRSEIKSEDGDGEAKSSYDWIDSDSDDSIDLPLSATLQKIREAQLKTEKVEEMTVKEESVLDTGQTEELKPVKEELILITIKSGEDLEDCCSLYKKSHQNHGKDCANFIDEKNDIPIIIEDDVIKKEEGALVTYTGKIECDSDSSREQKVTSSNFSMSSILSTKNSPSVEWPQAINEFPPQNAFLNHFYNLMPMYNPLQFFPNFSSSVIMNNILSPTFAMPNLGLVIPLLQNFNIFENAEPSPNLPQIEYSKRTNELSNVCAPRKKQKTEDEVRVNERPTNPVTKNCSVVLEKRVGLKSNRNTLVRKPSTKISSNKLSEVRDTEPCSICQKQYLSSTCLFYVRRKPVFKPNVRTCECCSDEDEDEPVETCEEKPSDLQKCVMNPGWYGKGYKKHVRKKR